MTTINSLTQPPAPIAALMPFFPAGSQINTGTNLFYVIGFVLNPKDPNVAWLQVSMTNPHTDYQGAKDSARFMDPAPILAQMLQQAKDKGQIQ